MPPRKWSQQRIIELLQERHRAGLSMVALKRQGASTLYYAALRYFGSVRQACQVAGITDPRAFGEWDRETVIAELRRLHHDNPPVTTSLNECLARAARKFFGSWRAALLAAELPCGPAPRRWTRQRVLDEIRRRHELGHSMMHREDAGLARAALLYIGGWSEALALLGIEPRRRRWSREDVLREIRRHYEQDGVLASRTDRRLTQAARQRFGTLRKAIVAAGFKPAGRPRRRSTRWTKQRIIDGIQDYWRRHGTLTGISVHSSLVYRAGIYYFGCWENAVRAAGLEPKSREQWSKQRVILELQACQGMITNRTRHKLKRSVNRWFGNWHAARVAAGVPLPQRWSRERVTEMLQDQHTRGIPMTTKHSDHTLTWAARKFYGSWAAALEAAGLGHMVTAEARRHQKGNVA